MKYKYKDPIHFFYYKYILQKGTVMNTLLAREQCTNHSAVSKFKFFFHQSQSTKREPFSVCYVDQNEAEEIAQVYIKTAYFGPMIFII